MEAWGLGWIRSLWQPSDIAVSRKLVDSLELRPTTAQFVLALRPPDSPSAVVYVLSVAALSEKSATDVHDLVAAAKPKAVVTQIEAQNLESMKEEERYAAAEPDYPAVPTTSIGVVHECFATDGEAVVFDSRARIESLRSIFGTGFFGHVVEAKRAASECEASFHYLDFPFRAHEALKEEDDRSEGSSGSQLSKSFAYFSSQMSHQDRAMWSDLLAVSLPQLGGEDYETSAIRAERNDGPQVPSQVPPGGQESNCPAFASPFFPFLTTVYEIFGTPALYRALQCTSKLLQDVENGRKVSPEDLLEAHRFRLAVEMLRVQCNKKATQVPSKPKRKSSKTTPADFYDLSYEDKCHALLAQALQQQAKKSGTVVAVMDVSRVAGIRQHWTTPVPEEVSALANECYISMEEGEEGNFLSRVSRMSLMDKQETKAAVVVGAGAAAAVGLSSLSNWGPISPLMTLATLKASTIAKLGLLQTKRSIAVALAKGVSPASKVVMPAIKAVVPSKALLGSAAAKSAATSAATSAKASVAKAFFSAEKVRTAAQSMVAAAEKASLSAIRTTFYSVMRKKQGKPVGRSPWLLFGSSVVAGAGIWFYGDGIERAIAAAPLAPAVARLGRGLKNLSQVSGVPEGQWDHIYTDLYNTKGRIS